MTKLATGLEVTLGASEPVLSKFATPLIPRWSPSFLFIIPDWQHRRPSPTRGRSGTPEPM